MLSAPRLHTPVRCLAPSSFWSAPNAASVPFTPLQNLPSLFTVCRRKTVLCKIAIGSVNFYSWLQISLFFMLFIIPIYCHLFTPLQSLSVCLSVYFRYINLAPNKCAFTEGQTSFLGWSLRWSGPSPKRPSWPVYSIVWPAFRHAAGPLMLLATALGSSHLYNTAERQVKRPPTRSVPIVRFFGGHGHTVKPHWIGRFWWLTTV